MRTREIGVRLAVGAQRRDIVLLFLRTVVWLAAVSVAAGVAMSFASTWLLRGLLFEVQPTEPALIALTAMLLAAVAAVATLEPARRASALDPVTALRDE